MVAVVFFFFFQAEDGIRDLTVTGVQTCALPIFARATVTGKPAEFEQKRTDTDQLARGHAGEIVYDVSDGTVRLTDDAWLTDGQNEISSTLLVYSIREQRVQAAASPGTDQRVHITITPHVAPAPGKTEPAKPPPADAGKGEPRAQPTVQP